jgi:hypothetical protein
MTMNLHSKAWAFSRIGGVDQVQLRDGFDISRLSELDQTLWAVLSIPVNQPDLAEILTAMDTDGDGKVRIPDILETVQWLSSKLKTLDTLFDSNASLGYDDIKDASLLDTFRQVSLYGSTEAHSGLASIGSIDTAMVDAAIHEFSSLPFNGDGIVTPKSPEDDSVARCIESIVGFGFSSKDASGEAGVSAVDVEEYKKALRARIDWLTKAMPVEIQSLLPQDRIKAYSLYVALKDPIDDFFRRCQVLAMDTSAESGSDLKKLLSAVVSRQLDPCDSELAKLPIAMPVSSVVLDTAAAFHPNFADALADFFSLARAMKMIGTSLSIHQWAAIKTVFEAYGQWLASEPLSASKLTDVKTLEDAFSADLEKKILALIGRDSTMASYARGLADLRNLIVLKKDFLRLLKNFVNFDDFYINKRGVFRSGKLYLDGKKMDLCIDVVNPAAHTTMAGLSSMYLLYCNLSSKDGKMKAIVAALTAGDAGNIFVGRNGVFYDSDGSDWDAVVTKVVVQPISIREAFFSPYTWFVKTLEDLAMKRAANAEAASMNTMKATAATAAQVDKAPIKPDSLPVPKKIDVGTVAAIGVALGSIGAMLTGILAIFFGMGIWMPLGFLGVLALISGPSMILAYMKLRKRNIGPLLNAEGWAVNGKLRINVPFGATLSHLATLPPGSSRRIQDPFADKKKPWGLYVLILSLVAAVVAAYYLGWLPLAGR